MNGAATNPSGAIKNVLEMVSDARRLPSLPTLVAELIQSFGNEDIDLTQIAGNIGRDQALVAKVLRLANSPFYGMQQEIGSVQEAIVVLGFNQIRNLVMAASLMRNFDHVRSAGLNPTEFWKHSLNVALCARLLTRGRHGEIAFTAGLMHDVGKLVLASVAPGAMQDVLVWKAEHQCSTREAEMAVVGADHAEIGAAVVTRWRLPVQICAAVANHHHPDGSPDPVTDAVYLANLGFDEETDHEAVREEAEQAMRRIKLDEEEWRQIMADCRGRGEALSASIEQE
jgi:putative nucleotidyltransferase with HDIG domain